MTSARGNIVRLAAVLVIGLGSVARADFGVPITSPGVLNSNAASDGGNDLNPKLAGDGHGHWVAVWESDDTLGGTVGPDSEIFVARSVDNGANWSIPIPLNTDAATDTGTDWNVDIATDGNGRWIAVWQSNSIPGAGTNYDILYARSDDNGATWSTRAPLSPNPATDSVIDEHPRVATDGKGVWVVVWDLAGGPGGPPDIVFVRSIDNGVNWSNPVPLKTSAAADRNPAIATDGQGHWVAAWESNDDLGATIGTDGDIFVARSIDNGVNWSLPIPLNTDAGMDSLPDVNVQLATDRGGHWVAVWQVSDIGTSAIRSARSIDNGAHWSSPVPIASSTSTGLFGSPRVAYGGPGHWVTSFLRGASGTVGASIDVLLARSIDNGANWSAPAPIPGDAGTLSGFPDTASVASDGAGAWAVVWSPGNTAGNGLGNDIDLRVARFALPDCNQNLVADSTEVLLGLMPDINNNNIPDICEIISGPPPGQTGCGAGLCGAGMTMLAPISVLGIACMSRVVRRLRS